MNCDYKNLHNKRVFVDANAIIYHLQGMCPTAREIFRLGESGKVNLVSTTRVIDEVIHKMLLIRAREKFGIHSKTIKKLRKDKDKVRQLSEDMRRTKRFCGYNKSGAKGNHCQRFVWHTGYNARIRCVWQ